MQQFGAPEREGEVTGRRLESARPVTVPLLLGALRNFVVRRRNESQCWRSTAAAAGSGCAGSARRAAGCTCAASWSAGSWSVRQGGLDLFDRFAFLHHRSDLVAALGCRGQLPLKISLRQ